MEHGRMNCSIGGYKFSVWGNWINLILLYLQEELDGLARNYPDHFQIYYVLNQVSCPANAIFPKLFFLWQYKFFKKFEIT